MGLGAGMRNSISSSGGGEMETKMMMMDDDYDVSGIFSDIPPSGAAVGGDGAAGDRPSCHGS